MGAEQTAEQGVRRGPAEPPGTERDSASGGDPLSVPEQESWCIVRNASSWTIEPLGPHHDRVAFSCGNASLDDFIKTKARKENELGYAAVFILIDDRNPGTIAGYYTLSSHFIRLQGIDAAARKRLPRYPTVPATLIGRLSRDLRFRRARG